MKSLQQFITESNDEISFLNFGFVSPNWAKGRHNSSVDSWEITKPTKDSAIEFLQDIISANQRNYDSASRSIKNDKSAMDMRAKNDAKTYKSIVKFATKELERVKKLK